MSHRPGPFDQPAGRKPLASVLRFVDAFGTAWRVYDRVVGPGSPPYEALGIIDPGSDVRAVARRFVRVDDGVHFEAATDDPLWVGHVLDLARNNLVRQLTVARLAGPCRIPPDVDVSSVSERARFLSD